MWAGRIEEFQRSGQTAPEFVRSRGYTASALKYWEKKLKAGAPGSLTLARVVRPGTVVEPSADDAVELRIGGTQVVVRRGFDPVLLRELVAALGGPQ